MKRRNQRGVTVVIMSLILGALCGMAALAVDVGILFTAKNSAQNAADAAALAGAFTFLKPSSAQPTSAVNAAVALANTNEVLGTQLSITSADVSVDVGNRRVTVTVPRQGGNAIPMFFARALGIQHEDVVATATAEASPVATGSICLRPIFVPNTILSSETPSQACSDGQTILGADGQLSPWMLANTQLFGSLKTIRPTSPQGALAPSQYYSLDFSGGQGSGASFYQCALGSNLADCGITPTVAACGTSYPTENGDMKGPTQAGIGTLLGATPDTWVGLGAYESPSGTITDTSNQLIVAPVWDDCCPGCAIGPGGGNVTIIGFSNWFVQGLDNSGTDPGVIGNFVNAAGCGAGGGGNGGGIATNASFGIPVRLVTPQ
ncbi:MAG TPA: pilus assembly protein TadG-related protein [Terriglobales bacterium]|nr:pilus assembly protein TadG-related protein [Terriglobales bacterium]